MRAPLTWLRELVDLPEEISPDEIADLLVRVGFEVEGIERQGQGISGPIVIGQVLAIEELSGHKKPIRFVAIDCGEGQARKVICGARNFSVGDLVVVAKPGAVLPGDFSISSRETYGKLSDGMICSSKELGLGDDHSGIKVIGSDQAKIGDDALALLQIDDVIFEVAVNPDRGYALSIRGLARELAGALDLHFRDPAELDGSAAALLQSTVTDGPIPVSIDDGATQIYLRSVDNVSPSAVTPLWMSRRIEKCGMRSISFPVDITNYLMLELGQPLHAFDSEKIQGSVVVRKARQGERLKTLDGEDRELSDDDLLISDESSPLALAGTMGGTGGEVNEGTLQITIEAAHFNPEAIAKNSRHHRLSTEASRRFERGVDPALPAIASARAVQLLIDHSGANYLGSSSAGNPSKDKSVSLRLSQLNQILGRDYSVEEMESMLDRIGAKSTRKADSFSVEVPSWRPDLQGATDFAEELARIHGYDLIPLRLPVARFSASTAGRVSENDGRKRRRLVIDFLAARGFAETQNYPFTSEELIGSLGFEGARARAFRLANPLSEDLPVLRTHILQSLLPVVMRNLNRGSGDLALFEIGRVFRAPEQVMNASLLPTGKKPSDEEIQELLASVPNQPTMVAGVVAGGIEKSGWWGSGRKAEWTDAISLASEVVSLFGSEVSVSPSDFAPWHPGRCAELKVDEIPVAHAGELHPRVIERMNLPARSISFAILLDAIPSGLLTRGKKLATMPPAIQDVALLVDSSVPSALVIAALREGAGEMLERIELFDRYEGVAPGKVSLAFTLTFRADDRTLTSEAIAEVRNRAVEYATRITGATLRG